MGNSSLVNFSKRWILAFFALEFPGVSMLGWEHVASFGMDGSSLFLIRLPDAFSGMLPGNLSVDLAAARGRPVCPGTKGSRGGLCGGYPEPGGVGGLCRGSKGFR